mgnify:CR=1 FL=1
MSESTLQRVAAACATKVLAPLDLTVMDSSAAVRLKKYARHARRLGVIVENGPAETPTSADLLDGDRDYLRMSNPRLAELRRRYAVVCHPAVARSRWTEAYVEREVPLLNFRADSGFVWQERDANFEINYALTYYYLKSIDTLGLLSRLEEDGLFGLSPVDVGNGRRVSRDLLDSVSEILFLERQLALSSRQRVRVLDVGAGYGRFAHRLVTAHPQAEVLCTDAVPESAFLCEYYLRRRGVEGRARVVPFDELRGVLDGGAIDLAVNICSFAEVPLVSIDGWIQLLAAARVRHFLIVPDARDHGGTALVSHEEDGRRLDYTDRLHAHGYRLVAREPKYGDATVQRYGVSPTQYHLYELAGADDGRSERRG